MNINVDWIFIKDQKYVDCTHASRVDFSQYDID